MTKSAAPGTSLYNQRLFEHAGDDADYIRISSEAEANQELDYLDAYINEKAHWNDQVCAFERGMGVLRGGALKFEGFKNGLHNIYPGIVAATQSIKSALVKHACLFISYLSKLLGYEFDMVGDYLTPLSTKVGHSTQIIADSCKFTILTISRNCPSNTILSTLLDLAAAKGSRQKTVAMEAICEVIQLWPTQFIESFMDSILLAIKRLLTDPSANTRAFARKAAITLYKEFKSETEEFFTSIPDRIWQQVEKEEPLPEVERLEPNHRIKPVKPHVKFVNPENVEQNIIQPETQTLDKLRLKLQVTAEKFFAIEHENSIKSPPKLKRKKSPKKKKVEEPEPEPPKKKSDTFYGRNYVHRTKISESKHLDDEAKKRLLEYKKKQKLLRQQQRAKEPEPVPPPPTPSEPSVESESRSSKRSFLSRNGPKETSLKESKHIREENKARIEANSKRANEVLSYKSPPSSPSRRVASPVKGEVFRKRKRSKSPKKTLLQIKLIDGQEADFITSLQEHIDSNDNNITFESKDLLKCCSHNSPSISASALLLLPDAFDLYQEVFNDSLKPFVEILLSLVENGNPRLAALALYDLNQMPEFFDISQLINFSVTQSPSIPLLKLISNFVSMIDEKFIDAKLATKLCKLASQCYDMGEVTDRHLAAQIIIKTNSVCHDTVIKFANSLPDKELREFEHFIQPYIPDLTFRNVSMEIPAFNVKGAELWLKRIKEISRNVDSREWREISSKVFVELNNALLSKANVDATLRAIQAIFTYRGINNFEKLMSGFLVNQTESEHIIDQIFLNLITTSSLKTVLDALQIHVTSDNIEIELAAIKMQTRIIATTASELLIQHVSMITSNLETTLAKERAEVRKATILCYVELYANLGQETMDQYITNLSKANQKLIIIYCGKRNLI